MGETLNVGDEIVCIVPHCYYSPNLKYNSRYIVTELEGIHYIKVYSVDEQQELPGVFNVNRFKLVKPAGATSVVVDELSEEKFNEIQQDFIDLKPHCGAATVKYKAAERQSALQRILLEQDMSAMNKELKEELDRSDRGARYNTGKPKLSFCLLGMETIEGEARVWEAGAKKYSRGNWLKGREYTECADSLLRHLTKFLNGHDIDEETGCFHVDLIHTSAKILAQSFHTRKDLDDRQVTKHDTTAV